eukprot:2048799-Rhodomonas_salina.1
MELSLISPPIRLLVSAPVSATAPLQKRRKRSYSACSSSRTLDAGFAISLHPCSSATPPASTITPCAAQLTHALSSMTS